MTGGSGGGLGILLGVPVRSSGKGQENKKGEYAGREGEQEPREGCPALFACQDDAEDAGTEVAENDRDPGHGRRAPEACLRKPRGVSGNGDEPPSRTMGRSATLTTITPSDQDAAREGVPWDAVFGLSGWEEIGIHLQEAVHIEDILIEDRDGQDRNLLR